jgi:hypothetical protein
LPGDVVGAIDSSSVYIDRVSILKAKHKDFRDDGYRMVSISTLSTEDEPWSVLEEFNSIITGVTLYKR